MDNIQQVTLTVESNQGVNRNKNTQIRAFAPPITNNYSIPLFLSPQQAEQFDPKFSNGQKDFAATLVKGNLKDGKDGTYPDHYWWNALKNSRFRHPVRVPCFATLPRIMLRG